MSRIESMPRPCLGGLSGNWKRFGLPLALLATGVFGYSLYHSLLRPAFGYGDEDMSEIRKVDPRALSGGDMTNFHRSYLPFEQEAPNLPWQLAAQFDRGDGLIERKFGFAGNYGVHVPKYGAGPLYNATSCATCHVGDGRAQPPAISADGSHGLMEGMFLRLSVPDGKGGWRAPDGYHSQLHDRGAPGVPPEGIGQASYEEISGQFADGERYTLLKPHYRVEQPAYGPIPADAIIEARVAPPIFGLGLLEAVAEKDILARANTPQPDGISGRPNWVPDPESGRLRLGRFSLKANQVSLRAQTAGAAFDDMGLSSPVFPRENCLPNQTACARAPSNTFPGQPELSESELQDLTVYLELLSVPARRQLYDPLPLHGEKLFRDAGCANCHIPTMQTGNDHPQRRLRKQIIHPYTDLLLHDMGPALSGRADHQASASEWRTPPLWGIGLTQKANGHTRFLHDGRARNLQEAILWHGGEASVARARYLNFSKAERDALLAFLNSL